jgi:hypothetical protein
MLINMCSFSASVRPLSSGLCLLRAPTSLNIIDAISLCTNVTTLEDEQNEEQNLSESDQPKDTGEKDSETSEAQVRRHVKTKQDGLSLSVFLET